MYGLNDIDKAYQALQQAEKRGYPLGNREKAQLADGYRDRADRTLLGLAQRPRPAAGEGPDPARARRLPARA